MSIRKPKGYWNFDNCLHEAKKYKYKSDFYKESNTAYQIAYKNNWLDKICNHMIQLGDKYKRCIYAIEFNDKYVYIGLTYNINKRFKEHLNNKEGSVFKHFKKTNENPIIKQITEYIEVKQAKLEEEKKLEEYKKNGWKILNKAKCGSIGGNKIIWDKETCLKAAQNCKFRSEFQKKYKSAYRNCLKYNWLDEVCSHMKPKLDKTIWTYNKCKKEALKYNNRRSFYKNAGSAYNAARKNNWDEEICAHMKQNHFKKYR